MNGGLQIGDLTHGVSATGAYDYLDGINAKAINNAINVLQNTSELKSTLQQGWQGAAEANFEKNLDNAVLTVVDTLEVIKTNIESLITDLVEDMANQDSNLVAVEDIVSF